jgi:protein-S-isoprenylcysteine O-methyltransferase Ste14
LATPYPYVFLVTSLLGLAVFQTGLQRCRIAVVAPLTNIVASVYVVAIGMIVFHERLPKSPTLSALRLVGFALVLVGSWFFSTGPATAGVEPTASVVRPRPGSVEMPPGKPVP